MHLILSVGDEIKRKKHLVIAKELSVHEYADLWLIQTQLMIRGREDMRAKTTERENQLLH